MVQTKERNKKMNGTPAAGEKYYGCEYQNKSTNNEKTREREK